MAEDLWIVGFNRGRVELNRQERVDGLGGRVVAVFAEVCNILVDEDGVRWDCGWVLEDSEFEDVGAVEYLEMDNLSLIGVLQDVEYIIPLLVRRIDFELSLCLRRCRLGHGRQHWERICQRWSKSHEIMRTLRIQGNLYEADICGFAGVHLKFVR